jgi:chemotaxis protein MotA
MNKTSVTGILLGITAILGGNLIEGGRLDSIMQGSAALIVFGGTLGATILSFSLRDIKLAMRMLKEVFLNKNNLPLEHSIANDIIDYSHRARKNGVLSLDSQLDVVKYGFFKRALGLIIDGIEPEVLQNTLEQENITFEEERGRAAKVFEAAGGFAPTIGIIGAVLGLIHVMENLSDPAMLGSGIAIAFVATIYGVASANLVFIPIAKKLINNTKSEIFLREMIIDGVMGIQAGRNPFYLREHLNSYLSGRQ